MAKLLSNFNKYDIDEILLDPSRIIVTSVVLKRNQKINIIDSVEGHDGTYAIGQVKGSEYILLQPLNGESEESPSSSTLLLYENEEIEDYHDNPGHFVIEEFDDSPTKLEYE